MYDLLSNFLRVLFNCIKQNQDYLFQIKSNQNLLKNKKMTQRLFISNQNLYIKKKMTQILKRNNNEPTL